MKTIFLFLTLLPFLSFSQKSDLNGYKYIYINPLNDQHVDNTYGITSSIAKAFASKGLIIANGYSENNVPQDLKANPCLLLTATLLYIFPGILAYNLKLDISISNCNNEKVFSREVSGTLIWTVGEGYMKTIKKMTKEIEAISYSFNFKITPEFKVKVNPDYNLKNSGLTEDSIKSYLDKNKIDAIEGIYKSYRTAIDNSPFYKFGVIKMGQGVYQAIIIESGSSIWKQGEIKMVLENTAMGDIFSIQYFMQDKSKVETFAFFSNNIIKIEFANAKNNNENSISSLIKTYPSLNTSFGQGECSERLITSSKGVSDLQRDTLQIKEISHSMSDLILVKTLWGEEINFSEENVWGFEDCGTYYRNLNRRFYKVKQIGSLTIYSHYYHHMRGGSHTDYYFSKTLDDKIHKLNRKNVRKQFKDNPCFLEKLKKEFKWYQEYSELYDTRGQYKFVSLYDQCKN